MSRWQRLDDGHHILLMRARRWNYRSVVGPGKPIVSTIDDIIASRDKPVRAIA